MSGRHTIVPAASAPASAPRAAAASGSALRVCRGLRALLCASAAALALAAALPVAAQEAFRVRAGEHPDYTRIVVDAAPGQQVAWGIEGDRMLLLLPEGAPLDVGPAARMRGLSRVGAIETREAAGGVALTVTLSCPCGARVQRLGDGRIVIDVSATAPRPPVPQAVAAALGAAAPVAEAAVTPPAAAPPTATPPAPSAPASTTPVAAPPAPQPPAAAPAAAPVAEAPPPRPPLPSPRPTAPAPAAAPPAPAQPASAQPAHAPTPRHAEAAGQAQPPQAEAPAAPHEAAPHEAAQAHPPALADETAATIEAVRQALLQQLTKAAEQGYVTLVEPPPEAPAEAAAEAPEAEHGEAGHDAHAAAEAAPEPAPDLPIRARTGSELSRTRRQQAGAAEDAPPAHCMPDDAFAMGRWTTDAPLDLQIGLQRRRMVGEFDAADADAVMAYVRLLIAHGFGLEAQGALQAFAAEIPPAPYLHDLARLVDGEGVGPETPVGAGLDCPGTHHVWATAAAAFEDRLTPEMIDVAALRPGLSDMPPRLRTRVVVPIATVALEAGRIEDAEVLAGMAARAEPPPPDGDGMLLVLLARIDAARGDWRRGEATLAPLLDHTSPAGIEAMIRMVEFRVARRAAPPRGLAENMEAIAFTLGSSELGRRLLRAAASARAAGEGLGLALGALRTLAERGGDPESAMAAARDMLVDYTPDPDEGVAYAEAVLAHEALLGDGPAADRARTAVARHFMAIGIDNLAERILAPALARNVAAARLTAAEAATNGGDALRAIELLDGLSGDQAARLRAAALFSIGDHSGAATVAEETGDAALVARYAWLAGDWEAATAAGDVDQRILAAWMAGGGEIPPELREAAKDDPSLAAKMETFTPGPPEQAGSLLEAAGAALEQSKRSRAVVGEILGDG